MMMRIFGGLVFALAVTACASSDHGAGKGVDAAPAPTCGDGVCASSEVSSCPQDCGQSNQQAVCGNSVCESASMAWTRSSAISRDLASRTSA